MKSIVVLGCVAIFLAIMFVCVESQYNYNYDGYSNGYNNNNGGYAHDRIPLAEISALTLRKGAMTTARRGRPINQLQCVGGSAQYSSYQPETVQCTNVGTSYDGSGVQWKCEAEMPSDYKFGNLRVSCEGYDSPTDPYVLKGSCGLQYELNKAEQDHYDYYQQNQQNPYHHNTYEHNYKPSHTFGFSIPTIIILVGLIYCCCLRGSSTTTTYPAAQSGTGYVNPGSANTYSTSAGSGSGSGWWTGAATGGLMGYLLGRNRSPRYPANTSYTQPNYNTNSTTM